MSFFEFPHTRTYDSDLGWLIRHTKKLLECCDSMTDWKATHEAQYKQLKDEVDGLVNNLVDVISPWDSSIAYHIFSIVSWMGNNYIAIQDVPIGTMITNEDYWQQANTVVEQINAIGVTVAALQDMFVTPEEFGAAGDGITNDTTAVQSCINTAYSENKVPIFRPDRVYAVTTITLASTMQSIDFMGTTLKALSTDTVLNIDGTYDTTQPNGFIKNLNIDMNFTSLLGLYVNHTWRKIYAGINIYRPAINGVCLHLDGANSAAGNLFQDIRARGMTGYTGTKFAVIDAGDNTFSNIDWVNLQYGIDLNRFTVFSKVHSYVTFPDLFPGSYMYKFNAPAQMSDIYPDTFQHSFIVETMYLAIIISNLVLVFNTSAIPADVTDEYPITVWNLPSSSATNYSKYIDISGLSINAGLYTADAWCNQPKAPWSIRGFSIASDAARFTIRRPGTRMNGAVANAQYDTENGSVHGAILHPEGYSDTITAVGNINAGNSLGNWILAQRWIPRLGRYPAYMYKAATSSYVQCAVIVEMFSTNQHVLKCDTAMQTGDILYVNVPVEDYTAVNR